MRRMTFRLASICFALFIVNAAHAADTKVRIGYTAGSEGAAAFVAKERGLFAKRGIDAELTLIALGSTLPAALVSKSIDVGGITAPSLLLAGNGGLKLTIVSGVSVIGDALNMGALARTGLSVKDPKDWEGKKVGVPGVGALIHILAVHWLKSKNIDPKRVTFVEVAFPTHLDTLKAGTVDIIATAQPNVDRIINSGTGALAVDLGAQMIGRGGVYWASTWDWANANPQAARNFKEAVREGGELVASNPALAREDTAKYLKLPPAAAASLVMPKANADVSAEDIEWWIKTLADQDLVDGKMKANDFIFK